MMPKDETYIAKKLCKHSKGIDSGKSLQRWNGIITYLLLHLLRIKDNNKTKNIFFHQIIPIKLNNKKKKIGKYAFE